MKIIPRNPNPQIAEFDPDDILNKAVRSSQPTLVQFEVRNELYFVNMANVRYSVFKQNKSCSCCGIIANRMFLEPYFNETDHKEYHRFNLYAETKYKSDAESHLVLMTVDHIIPRRKGGTDDMQNYQTLCWSCNIYKENTDLPINIIRNNIAITNLIYRSTYALRETKFNLHKCYKLLDSTENYISSISKQLDNANPKVKQILLNKIEQKRKEYTQIQTKINQILLEAQTTGIIQQPPLTSDLLK